MSERRVEVRLEERPTLDDGSDEIRDGWSVGLRLGEQEVPLDRRPCHVVIDDNRLRTEEVIFEWFPVTIVADGITLYKPDAEPIMSWPFPRVSTLNGAFRVVGPLRLVWRVG